MTAAAVTSDGQRSPPGWDAALELHYEARTQRTVLAARRHHGPLAVQRPFYPESDGTCHTYILHPPGGIVSGDHLSVEVVAGNSARVLLTTPAATKAYRSAGHGAQQHVRLLLAAGAQLEWLPQETIVYDAADFTTRTRVDLAPGAAFLGWEISCLGRPASGERFDRGRLEQRFEVWREREPLLLERARYEGGSLELSAAWGLGQHPVVGALVCVGPGARSDSDWPLDALRASLAAAAPRTAACSALAGALVCRYVGDSVEQAQLAFRAAWSVLRLHTLGKAPVSPRIWAT